MHPILGLKAGRLSLLLALLGGASVCLAGCAAEEDVGAEEPLPAPTTETQESPQPAETGRAPAFRPPPATPVDDAGPAPVGCGTLTKDKNGFFTRSTGKASYVGFVPSGYAGEPTMLVVGMHGCGDTALNFATWGINPAKGRSSQKYIGISIGGADGKCWDATRDVAKVTAAIEDVSSCLYVHSQKVVLAGYSSGGLLAYRLGLSQSEKYAGILVENAGLGGAQPSAATWKINVAHIAHKGDTSFPFAKVQADWAKLEAAGLPLQKRAVEGGHDGASEDWSDFLLPRIGAWKAP